MSAANVPGINPGSSGTMQTSVSTSNSSVSSSGNITPISTPVVSITEEESNFLRLTSLILKIVPGAVRKLFDMHNHPSGLKQKFVEKANKEKLKRLLDRNIINSSQWAILYPANGTPSSSNFDLTLMILLLREISGVSVPSAGWNRLPPLTEISDGADLARIKHYRNWIAHATQFSLSNYEFTRAWKELEQVVLRIGGQSYEIKINALMSASLDHSNADLYRELRNFKTEKSCTHMQDFAQKKLEFWRKEDKSYVPTRATAKVLELAKMNSILSVCGPPGSGKSATIHHIALELKQQGYEIWPVSSPNMILEYWIPEGKQAFIIDDGLGIHALDKSKQTSWESCVADLELCQQFSDMKLLVSIRTQVFRDELANEILSSLKSEIIFVDEHGISLSKTERRDIFHRHARFHDSNDLLDLTAQIAEFNIFCFPLLCRLFAANIEPTLSPDELFRSPLQVLGNLIRQLKLHDPVKYFCLIICVLYDNNLDASIFSLVNENKHDEDIRKCFLELCKLPNSTSRQEIKSQLECLLYTYLLKEGDRYRFIHDLVQDAVISSIPSSFNETVLYYCSSAFVKERICLNSAKPESNGTYIVLEKELESKWGNRILADIKDGFWYDVFTNKYLMNSYCEEVIAGCLSGMTKSEVQNIMCKSVRQSNDSKIYFEHNDLDWQSEKIEDVFENTASAFHWLVIKCCKHLLIETCKYISAQCINHMSSKIDVLSAACIPGDMDVIRLLLQYERDFPESGSSFDLSSAFHVSAAQKHIEVMELLISLGANVNGCETFGTTPLILSSEAGYNEVIKVLINHQADINRCDCIQRSPLLASLEAGHKEVARMLINQGAEVNTRDSCGRSPMTVSSESGYEEIVELLINVKAVINIPDGFGNTPLFLASKKGHIDVAKLLIKSGAEINEAYRSNWEGTPLYAAASAGHYDLIQILIHNGADLNSGFYLNDACNQHSETPLYRSLRLGHDMIAKHLIEKGADVNLGFWHDEKALDFRLQILKTPLYVTIKAANYEIVNSLIDYKSDLDKVSYCIESGHVWFHESPLETALDKGDDSLVKILIDNGAKPFTW